MQLLINTKTSELDRTSPVRRGRVAWFDHLKKLLLAEERQPIGCAPFLSQNNQIKHSTQREQPESFGLMQIATMTLEARLLCRAKEHWQWPTTKCLSMPPTRRKQGWWCYAMAA